MTPHPNAAAREWTLVVGGALPVVPGLTPSPAGHKTWRRRASEIRSRWSDAGPARADTSLLKLPRGFGSGAF